MRSTADRIRRRIGGFAADMRGATAVEFTMIGFPFLLVFCSIVESAFLVFNQGMLEAATYAASRQLLTGQAQTASGGAWTAAQFTNAVCGNLQLATLKCANLLVDVRSASDFTTNPATTNIFTSGTTYSPGASGNVIVVRVGYPYKLWFNVYGGFGGGTRNIQATTVFKSENY